MLKIEHLTKKYGDFKAVDDLSLSIAPGEIYGFIGHNGAGKTTTLKSLLTELRSSPIPSKAKKKSLTFRTIRISTNL